LGAYAPGTRENILKHQTEYEQKFRAYIIDIICMQAKFRKKMIFCVMCEKYKEMSCEKLF
jgi:hypothetical protein